MIGILVLICVLLATWYHWMSRRPKNFPPGPRPLPVVGNMFDLPDGHLYPLVEKWSKQYGQIIGLSMPKQLMVIVTGVDQVLEALRKEEFQSRPDLYSVSVSNYGNRGIFFSSGERWMVSRKFVVKHLRSFGKDEKENVMLDEISQLMDTLKDGTIQGNGIFGLSALNVIWKMVANKRLDLNDQKSRQFCKNLFYLMRNGSPSGKDIVNLHPVFGFFSSNFKFGVKVSDAIHEYMRAAIKEHEEVLDCANPLDLFDNYLAEMKDTESSYFTEKDLICIASDLFLAGAESTSNSIEFILLYMVLYPEVQERMQHELDQVLGRARRPKLEDKTEMHYTMSVISEVERINSVVPTNVPHHCTKDTTFGGYFIPKGTIISMNLRSLGYDSKYWENPESFKPDRFLNAQGKFNKSSILATFGLGQRACVGEVFSRNIIFLFTSTFFEKFSISLPPGEPKPSTVALPGFTTAPQSFKIHIKSRY